MAKRDLTGAVDFAYLEAYAAGDEAMIDEVLSMFREQAAMWMRMLDPAAPAGAWRDAAHILKGAALGIGARDLAAACDAAEGAAQANVEERRGLLDAVLNAADLALADVAAYVHERALQSLKSPRRRG